MHLASEGHMKMQEIKRKLYADQTEQRQNKKQQDKSTAG